MSFIFHKCLSYTIFLKPQKSKIVCYFNYVRKTEINFYLAFYFI